ASGGLSMGWYAALAAAVVALGGLGYSSLLEKRNTNACLTGSSDDLIQACTKAIDSQRLTHHESGDAYLRRAGAYLSRNDSSNAINDYNKGLNIRTSNPLGYSQRGWAHFKQGNTTLALQDLSWAVSYNNKDSRFYSDPGRLYLSR